MKTTVTYTGANSMLLHTGRNGDTYMFECNRPLQVFNEEDIQFYRRKQANGSPFIVTPKLQPVVEPIEQNGVWERAKPTPRKKPMTRKTRTKKIK